VVPVLSRLTAAYEARGRLYRLTKFQFSLFEFAVHKVRRSLGYCSSENEMEEWECRVGFDYRGEEMDCARQGFDVSRRILPFSLDLWDRHHTTTTATTRPATMR
jgi:hypothetical protein